MKFSRQQIRAKKKTNGDSSKVRLTLPSKDQVATNAVHKQLSDLSHRIGPTLQPVSVSSKLGQDLKPKEIEQSIVKMQSVVYHFLRDLCHADYVK